jgi:hypothetical protein
MECADQVEAVVVDTLDRSEPLVAERLSSELLEAPTSAVVVELGLVGAADQRAPDDR